MAFSADEVRVLRRALAALDHAAQLALTPGRTEEDTRACRGLARMVDEASDESARQYAFLLVDLECYRSALPGAAAGYLDRLHEAITLGAYVPTEADLESVNRLCAEVAGPEDRRNAAQRTLALVRATLPDRLETVQSRRGDAAAVSPRLAGVQSPARPALSPQSSTDRSEMSDKNEPRRRPGDPRVPAAPRPSSPQPSQPAKPVPTPSEAFPPRRRPAPSRESRIAAFLS